jgi:hypothetical protein
MDWLSSYCASEFPGDSPKGKVYRLAADDGVEVDDGVESEGDGERKGPEQSFPFELRFESKYVDIPYMLKFLSEAGLVYREDRASDWSKNNWNGTRIWLRTSNDAINAAQLLSSNDSIFATTWSPVTGGDSMATQKQIHIELEKNISLRRRNELWDIFYDLGSSKKEALLSEFLENGAITWSKLPEARILKIWRDYAAVGFVRDEKGMADIAAQTIDIIVRMSASNDLGGRETSSALDDLLEDMGYTEVVGGKNLWTNGESTVDLSDFYYSIYVSDYSMDDLRAAAILLMNASTAEEQLTYVDRILNTVHQSSDLSLALVEHGQHFLNTLYG